MNELALTSAGAETGLGYLTQGGGATWTGRAHGHVHRILISVDWAADAGAGNAEELSGLARV